MKSQLSKVLHPVGGRPMVSIVATAAASAGFDPIVLVVPREHSQFTAVFGAGQTHVVQDEPLGTGHALLQARKAVVGYDNLLVLNGDIPLVEANTLAELSRVHIRAEAPITLLTSNSAQPDGLGRVKRTADGAISAIVEQVDADADSLHTAEINAGVYCFQTSWLWENLPEIRPSSTGEVFLTDLIARAARQGHTIGSMTVSSPAEALGINNRVELARAETELRERIRTAWMLEGVSIPDPTSVYIDYDVRIGTDTTILPNTHLKGMSVIGRGCAIGPNSIVADSEVGDHSHVVSSVVEGATLESEVHVGPFSHIRPGTHLESDVHIGNFGEVKNSRIGRGTKSGHFSYIGDAQVGSDVNIGAGSVTCNYDGAHKHQTTIGDKVFIGCDTMMVAPVTLGDRSYTSAGAVVTRDVPADHGAIGAPARMRAARRSKRKT